MSLIRKVACFKTINRALTASVTPSQRSFSNEFILRSDLADVEIPKVSVDQYLFANIDKWPHRVAAECAATGRKYTYEEAQRNIVNLSRNLRKKLKLEKGDVVTILLTNSPEYLIVAAAALKAGLVVSTLNPIYTPDEISRQLKDSETKAIITFADFYPLARASVNLVQAPIHILTIKTQQGQPTPDGALNFSEFTENIDYADLPPASPDDVAFLPYSSGTTGLPKGVQLTHGNIVANLCQFDSKQLAVVEDTTSEHQDVVPAVLPQFHIYGLTANTLHLFFKGSQNVTLWKFSPELYIQTLRKYKPHVLFAAPPLVLFLISHPAVTSEDLQPVRTLVSGAAPLGALDEERFMQKAKKEINIFQGYGLTETSPMVTFSRGDLRKLPNSNGTIGRPVSQTVCKIVDPNDPDETPLGPNKTGEMLIKGPQVMKGYHNRPEQTKEIFTKDGWLRTGDMMYYNENNLLFVADRLKELIKVKGFQVPPAELEQIIRHYPNVEDAAVVGIPHSQYGEVPRAYIVTQQGKTVDVKGLDEFVSQKVAPYKRLKGGIEVVESIPKNASGKIMRRVLKEQYQAVGK